MKGDDGVINKGDHLDEDCGRVELLNNCLNCFLLQLMFAICQVVTNLLKERMQMVASDECNYI